MLMYSRRKNSPVLDGKKNFEIWFHRENSLINSNFSYSMGLLIIRNNFGFYFPPGD